MPVRDNLCAPPEYMVHEFDPFISGPRLFITKWPSFMKVKKEDEIPSIEDFARNYRQEQIRNVIINKKEN